MSIFTHLINQMKIILDKKEGGVILFHDSDVKELTMQRSPRETIWGFYFFQDKDALFKAKLLLKRALFFKGQRRLQPSWWKPSLFLSGKGKNDKFR